MLKNIILINVNNIYVSGLLINQENPDYSYFIESTGFLTEHWITRYMIPEKDITMIINIGIRNILNPIVVLYA